MSRLRPLLPLVLCLSMGCADVQYRILSAAAVGSIAADRASTAAYLVEADAALETAEEEGLGFAWYCREVQGAWDRVSDLTCGAAALADLAVLGQDLLEAGSDLDAAWFGRVCGAADVVIRVLEALDAEIPGVLRTVRSAVCGAAESVEPPGGCVPPVVPGCEEVLR